MLTHYKHELIYKVLLTTRCFIHFKGFEDLNLFSLGNDRRSLTRKALKNVILHKLGEYK